MLLRLILVFLGMGLAVRTVYAADIPWGVHLFQPQELLEVLPYRGESQQFFVTVPMSMSDRDEKAWNQFFELSLKSGITPIIRWVTVFENDKWSIPNRKDVTDSVKFMESLHWAGKRHLVLFNEPNHAAEWGGNINPEEYVEVALFAANWLKTEKHEYVVLPAGLDAAAPNGSDTMDSFTFLDRMYRYSPEFFEILDGWTSHAYPNPAFASSPYRRAKDSLWGFEIELNRLKQLTGRDYEVYITETGWRVESRLQRLMSSYYRQAVNGIWKHPSVRAVTVFVFRAASGPFAGFSLIDDQHRPTAQFKALLDATKP